MSCDLHRHTEFSRFDGFGKAHNLAKLAKELGYTALGVSDHGNTNGLVQMHDACQRVGIKPILGVEGYFLPVYKAQERGYHLCLFAKDLVGYRNLNALQFEGEKQKYYNPIWTFELLEKYHEGLICSTACIAGYSAQCIVNDKMPQARKYMQKLKDIFGDDLYVEVQPYVVSEAGVQEKVNIGMIELAEEFDIKCILTSDSHRGEKDEFDTYLKMHTMNNHDEAWVRGTYEERYMPPLMEMEKRFYKMHRGDYGDKQAKKMALEMQANMEELEAKVEQDILGQLKLQLPKIGELSDEDSWNEIVRQVKAGLKKRGQYTKEYIQRCKEELDVIKKNGFVDYFLIVADYVNWAKDRDICVGPGRGSVCNCLVAYAMYITEVDSIRFGLDFRRFMRYDKKAIPDIDLDFEMDRRGEVIDYVIGKYPGQSARVSSYGLYQVDNTINSLAKVCGLDTDKTVDDHEAKTNKDTIKEIKALVRKYKLEDGSIDDDALLNGADADQVRVWNKKYDNIITHFCKLFGKVQFIGTHSAGVVLTSGDILQYTSIRLDKEGNLYSTYNLEDLNDINIVKFDILGLKTMQSIGECRKLVGVKEFDINLVDDQKLLQAFREGNTCGIFQFEKATAKRIFDEIQCDCFEDVVATCAMNRPGPLGQGMPEQYAENKLGGAIDQDTSTYQYTKATYGTVVYQEQLLLICVFVGGLEWFEADLVLKANKHGFKERAVAILNKYAEDNGVDLHKKFVKNAVKNGMTKEQAEGTWNSLLVYSFNKGHAAGYCIISMEEMYYKIYYPQFFWYVKIKYARNDTEKVEFNNEAAKDGEVIFLPHVNYSKPHVSIRKVDGEEVLQQGLMDIKGIGEKAATAIRMEREKNGVFTSFDDFLDRCAGRVVHKGVVNLLSEQGALEFNKKMYIKRVTAYNTALYSRARR